MGIPQPAPIDDEHALKLMLAVLHGLARFVDTPEYRADVDLVAREWDGQVLPIGYGDEAATPYPAPAEYGCSLVLLRLPPTRV